MSKELTRKFGVKKISRFNLDLICKDCGKRAGLHHEGECPTIEINTGKLSLRGFVQYLDKVGGN